MHNDFDNASKKYDDTFTFSKIGKAQRKRVFTYVNPLLKTARKLRILELNCGTGVDAIHFSKSGHSVIATDISEGMITVAKAKKHTENVVFQVQDINTIRNTSFEQKFDLIFSNFGGLNCLAKTQLEQFLKTANQLLAPNGKLILVIMPKKCLWEKIYFSAKGQFKKANRRNTDQSLAVPVDGVTVKTWYYNPKEILSLTKKGFTVNKIKPIGLAIPPSYLENSILTKKPLLSIFKGIDTIATGAFWAKYADHFLIELTKK
ncbi:class I SAM-dependent methyltransferase [Lacinutrix himadriensis]|uniref:class I SAM-dependent methyltransferase n=1 Tax=Lacinutrix himadriensis TaxID=641549 RepID=UPI0006E375AF|nr:class I SAM-dependent methyltransferase [Lacinutrix himadriensis]